MQRSSLFSRAASDSEPLFGTYLRFDNETDNDTYVRATTQSVLTDGAITVEAWVKIHKPSQGDYIRQYPLIIYSKPQSPMDYGYIFRMDAEVEEASGHFRPAFRALIAGWTDVLNLHNSSVIALSNQSFDADVWHHIAGVAYGSGDYCYADLYVDGVPTAHDKKYHPACAISTQNPQELLIGQRLPSDGGMGVAYNLTGAIDELRVSRGILYDSQFAPPALPFTDDTDSALLLYHFNDLPTTVIDTSGKGSHGTLIGSHFALVPNSELPMLPPSPTPEPTNTPVPAMPPVIETGSLPDAFIKQSYAASVMGFDANPDEQLTMTVTGLPNGIAVSACSRSERDGGTQIQCPISGIPKGAAKTYTVTARLRDTVHAAVTKTYQLRVIR
jgi:hypothetical protein